MKDYMALAAGDGWMDGFNFQMWFLAGCLGAIGKAKHALNSAKKVTQS